MEKKTPNSTGNASTGKKLTGKTNKPSGQASKNSTDQKKKTETHHIPRETKIPRPENTDPFSKESSVY